MRTRVGYAGGTKDAPTYHSLGDHTEAIQIDFDPSKISYEKLLELFWTSHSACAPAWSQQYKSAVFYHDEAQKKAAHAVRGRVAAAKGKLFTDIQKAGRFWLAEDYHQKYQLRHVKEVVAELEALYPELRDFVDSTAVTRINAWLGGHGSRSDLERDLGKLGLSADAQKRLRAIGAMRLAR